MEWNGTPVPDAARTRTPASAPPRAQGLYQAKATHLTCTQSKSHDLMGSPSSRIKYCVGYPLHSLSLSLSSSLLLMHFRLSPNLSPIYLGIQTVIKYLWPGRVLVSIELQLS